VAEPVYCPGGSSANVMKGIANLGGEAAFVGMLGRDEMGRRYRELLAAQNVRPVLLEAPGGEGGDGGEGRERGLEGDVLSSLPPANSAQCLSLVEQDGQRTMRTYLGASLHMEAADFPEEEALAGARLLHVEGYTLYRPELAKAAMKAAKARGALVSLDLASFEVVRNCRAQLLDLLESGVVDLLFANEDEAEELMGSSGEDHRRRSRDDKPAACVAKNLSNSVAAVDDAAPAGAEEERREGDEAEVRRMKTTGEEETRGAEDTAFTREDAERAMQWMLRYCQVPKP